MLRLTRTDFVLWSAWVVAAMLSATLSVMATLRPFGIPFGYQPGSLGYEVSFVLVSAIGLALLQYVVLRAAAGLGALPATAWMALTVVVGIGEASPLGMLIYSRDWFNPSAGLVEQLASRIPTLIAWKDGQADLRRYQMIRQRLGDRLHWIGGAGDDMVPGYYSMGIRTYTSSKARIGALTRWLHRYNYHRCHTALGGKPPISRVTNLPSSYS